jgi:tellurite resistance protein
MLNLTQVDLDAATALCIAAGMKEMANADEDLHDDEVALIDGFLNEVQQEHDVQNADQAAVDTALLDSTEKQELFLQCLTYVALADGKIQDQETALLQKYIDEFGLPYAPQDLIQELGKAFLQRYRGVQVFRDKAFAVGRGFGLSDEQIQEVLG